jgi:glycerate kinase
MKIIIAPQAFKGSLDSHRAALAMEKGVKAANRDIETVLLPMADGGAGTVRAMVEATGGRLISTAVKGPLGDKVAATWGILGDGGTAVIEMAAASGLALIPEGKLNPMLATTYGTGELVSAALESGCRKVIIGLGDSATVDAGAGMAQALGVKLLDENNRTLGPGGAALAGLKRIDISGRHPLIEKSQILGACDVNNALCGPEGAAAVYGPQKGATPPMVEKLDRALGNFAEVVRTDTGIDVKEIPGAGAAGGMGAGLIALLNGKLRSGLELVFEGIGFDKYLANADLIITGEGRLDYQTAFGKTVAGTAMKARAAGVPVVAVCGELGRGYREVFKHGVSSAMSIAPGGISPGEAMQRTEELITDATERLVRIFCISHSDK